MLILATILVVSVGGYLAALILALQTKRRVVLHDRFDAQGRSESAEWIVRERPGMLMFLSLLRACCRVGFVVLVMFDVGLVQGVAVEGDALRLSLTQVLVAGAISVAGIWIITTIIALAVAEHAGVGLIVVSMPLLRLAAFLGRPVGRVFSFVDRGVSRLSGTKQRGDEAEAELLLSIEETHLEGALEPQAAAMLENVVEFRSTQVSEVMTPRTDIEGLELTDDIAAVRAFIRKAGHSRIPVYEETLDHIVGILYVKDLIRYLGEDADGFRMKTMLRRPIVVPASKPVSELLSDFQRSEVHLAIVIDEYGGTSGLITIEDVLEEIVGEIHDEHEPESEQVPTLVTIDDTHVEVDGRFHVYDLNERLHLEVPDDGDYDTVAGFMMQQLGRVPAVGDTFEFNRARFTAIAATRTHVNRIGIELPAHPHDGAADAATTNGEAGSDGDGVTG